MIREEEVEQSESEYDEECESEDSNQDESDKEPEKLTVAEDKKSVDVVHWAT